MSRAVGGAGAARNSGRGVGPLPWLGWTLLYAGIWLAGGWLASAAFGDSAAASILTYGAIAAATFLIGVRYRSDAWPLGPLTVGIALPVAGFLLSIVAAQVAPDSLGTLWALLLLAAMIWLVPLSVVMAVIAWRGVRHGKRRTAAEAALASPAPDAREMQAAADGLPDAPEPSGERRGSPSHRPPQTG
ncbi:MAG: hypothetical protein ACKOWF_04160 [Chloroflexota bacterium]